MSKCLKCGALFSGKDKFCPECGGRLSKKPPKWFLIVDALFLCIIIASFLITFLGIESPGGLLGRLASLVLMLAIFFSGIFSVVMFFYFIIKGYEKKSWLICLIFVLIFLYFFISFSAGLFTKI